MIERLFTSMNLIVAQPAPHGLQHGYGDILPILVRLQLEDELQFRRDHRDILELLEQARDRNDLLAQTLKRMIRSQQCQLRPEDH